MPQDERKLQQAVADVTGEAMAEIDCRGYPLDDPDDAGNGPLVIDWDALGLSRGEATSRQGCPKPVQIAEVST